MNLLLDSIVLNGLLLDAAGMIGLCLLALAAVNLADGGRYRGGAMMAVGAVLLLLARIYFLISPHLITNDLLSVIGPIGNALMIGLPSLLLSFGTVGVVAGLWCYERHLHQSR